MSTSVSLNGTSYTIPATGENTWGDNVSSYLIALGSGVLQKAGGSFTLTAEVDFGATYGLKSSYYKSRGTNPASAGEVRLANTEGIYWRNAANSGNLALVVSASNVLTFNSLPISAIALGTANQVLGMNSGASAQEYKTISGTSNQITVTHGSNSITLSTPQDIGTGSSPTFAGVTLSGVTASRALVTNGSSAVAASAVTATELGYLSGVTTPTGSGALVLATSPTLVTPVLGAATGTSLQLSGLTASKAMVTDASKNLASSAVTATELGYLSGVTTPTGSGALVLATSPTLVTPTLGVATATSINKVTLTAPVTGSTLTIADGKTLTASNTLTFTGTDSSSVAFGAGGTVVYTSNKLSVHAATTSSELAGVISDETGSGALVFGTTPTLATPVITTAATFNAQAELRLADADSSNYVGFKAPSTVSANKVWTLPSADGGANQVLSTDGSGTLQWATAAGAGGINYVSNADFEANTTTGYATYADSAATTPVDGTGGSPNSTFAATSSSPLRGTYSGLFTKGAANRQGEGFSYDFTIAAADKSRPLLITWEGEASANYTGSSGSEYMVVYVYDVTNATLIAPASTTVAPGTSKGSTFFVATTSTSYRLIFHVAGTGTSSWTYKIDTVSVGPQSIAMGPALTEWKSETGFTYTGFGTVSTQSVQTRRVGDTLFVRGNFTAGTVSATAATIILPTGLTLDTTKLSTTTRVPVFGWGAAFSTAGTVNYTGGGNPFAVTYDGTNSDRVALADYVSSNSFASRAGNNICIDASGDIVSFEFSIPISQWSSSNFQTADRAVEEYGSNNGTWDANDTTSFVYGPNGSAMGGGLSSVRTKRVRFQQPIQPTDRLVFEVAESTGNTWMQIPAIVNGTQIIETGAFNNAGNGYTGGVLFTAVNSTDVDISFSRYASASLDFSSVLQNWPTGRWRIRKTSGGASVGYPVSSQNIIGRTDGVAPSAGYVGEIIEGQYGPVNQTASNGTVNGSSISLTPGRWLITHICNLSRNGATSSNFYLNAGISVNSASTTGTSYNDGSLVSVETNAGTANYVSCMAQRVVNLTSTTTYYGVFQGPTYSAGTPQGYGVIRAVRIA